MARFRLAARAAADLDEIWFTIALDNVDAADRIIASHGYTHWILAFARMTG